MATIPRVGAATASSGGGNEQLPRDTRLCHPFAEMGKTRSRELILTRGDGVWVWDDYDANTSMDRSTLVRERRSWAC